MLTLADSFVRAKAHRYSICFAEAAVPEWGRIMGRTTNLIKIGIYMWINPVFVNNSLGKEIII